MRNIRLLLEYDGTAYVGWQRQASGPSIQGALEEALRRLTGEVLRTRAAAAPMPASTPSPGGDGADRVAPAGGDDPARPERAPAAGHRRARGGRGRR